MRGVFISCVICFFIAFHADAQGRYAIVWAVATDTVSKTYNPAEEKMEQFNAGNNENAQGFQCWPREKMKANENEKWCEWQHGPVGRNVLFHLFRRLVLIPAMFGVACLFVMFVVNILLTILVAIDMAQRNQFNGLWIPVLVLAGIPGTGLYALFRIGDTIKAREQKP